MSTTAALGLTNSYGGTDQLPAADVNALANGAEAAFAGMLSLDVSGSTDVTLTSTQARNPILYFDGTLTGSINIIVPTWKKRWLVVNATTGSYTLTVKTASGSGIAITQGYSGEVYGDGTDILRRGSESSGSTARLVSPRVVTSILDSGGNELLNLTATASAVNELTLSNGATGAGPILEASGETNVDATFRGKGSGGVQLSRSGGKLGFFGVTLASRAAALTQTYATADRTLSAYTSDPESTPYTGAADSEAKLADLNALRTAYENLRAFTEDLAGFVNALVDDLQSYGLEQ